MVQVPAGWYPDPQDANSKRYGDGTAWTAQRHPREEAAAAPTPNVPAGWYPDPQDATSKRYWDGTTWTAHQHPTQNPASSPKLHIRRPAEQSTLKRWTQTLSPKRRLPYLRPVGFATSVKNELCLIENPFSRVLRNRSNQMYR